MSMRQIFRLMRQRRKAGDFMQAIGIESMIKTGESDCEWEGYNKTEG